MIQLNVKSISLSNVGFVVMLTTEDKERNLPIFIGVPEAQAIALQVNQVKSPRPMTHDLLKSILDLFESSLEKVIITDLSEGTFYAQMEFSYEGSTLQLDSRPSDGIALALRCGVPIFAEEKVMDEAGIASEELERKEGRDKPESDEEMPSGPESELQKLQKQLQDAIKEERYEEAARLRDEIKQKESTN